MTHICLYVIDSFTFMHDIGNQQNIIPANNAKKTTQEIWR